MLRALYTAATGMEAQQINIDTIANNIANVNTTGFKQARAEFQDLLYQNVRPAGTAASTSTEYPRDCRSDWVRVRSPPRAFIGRAISVRPAIRSTLLSKVKVSFKCGCPAARPRTHAMVRCI